MKGYVPSQHHEAEVSQKLARARRAGKRTTIATGREMNRRGPVPTRVDNLSAKTILWIRSSWTKNGGHLHLIEIARYLKIRERTISKICRRELRADVD